MANWLQKFTSPPNVPKNTLPAKAGSNNPLSTLFNTPGDQLPNASLIYGIAASALMGVAIYFLLTGRWFTGFLILLPAGCFLGYALHFIKSR